MGVARSFVEMQQVAALMMVHFGVLILTVAAEV